MIGLLKGTLAYRNNSSLILLVQGVGYKVFVPQSLFTKHKVHDELTLFTHTHVREDLLELYGFATPEDLKLFEYLISVSGIGCKTALGIFSVGERQEIVSAIRAGDTTFFTSVPRLGKKNAQKLIIELKTKLGGEGELDLVGENESSDVIQALLGIGFSREEAIRAVKNIGKEGSVEEKIKQAIQYLGK